MTTQYCDIGSCETPAVGKVLTAPGWDRRKNRYFHLCEPCRHAYLAGYWRAHYEAHHPHKRKAV